MGDQQKVCVVILGILVNKTISILGRNDFNTISFEKLFKKLKTFEMEIKQRRTIYGPGSLENKNTMMQKKIALLGDEPFYAYQALIKSGRHVYLPAQIDYLSARFEYAPAKMKIIKAKTDEVFVDLEDEFYTLEELEQLKDKSMAYMATRFKHIKFIKNPRYQKASRSKLQGKGGYSGSESIIRSSMPKSNVFCKSKVKCYNYNDLEIFVTKCRKPETALVKEKSISYEKKNSYRDLKRENERLKAKLKAIIAKYQGKAYLVEGKS